MKKKAFLFFGICILVVFSLVTILSGCKEAAEETTDAETTMAKETTAAETVASEKTAEKQTYEIAVVTKVQGIPWFDATGRGVDNASKDLGVNAYQVGPAQADPAQQVKVLEDMVSKGVDAILTWPNDSKSIEPTFQKAMDQGIVCITLEAPGQKYINWNVDLTDITMWWTEAVELMVKAIDEPKGEYVIFTGGATVQSHNQFADIIEQVVAENYPDLKLATPRIPTEENQQLAHDKMLDLIKAYPDLKGVFAIGSINGPGAAQALREKGLIGKIAIISTSIPSDSEQYLDDGSMTASIIPNPIETTYGAVVVAYNTLTGVQITDGMEIKGLGEKVKVEGNNITGSSILVITKENAASLGF